MSSGSRSRPIHIFLAYAYEDRVFREALNKHLVSLQRSEVIDDWHEYEILPGSDWQSVDNERLNHADIILLLITPAFIASDYCYNVQMQRALERNADSEARVLPIICRPVYIEDLPIAQIQLLPRSDPKRIKAVSEWENADRAYTEIVTEIKRVIEELSGFSPIQAPSHTETASQPMGTRYLTYNGHSNYVISVAWSPNGKYIASGGGDSTVRVWDVNTGATLYTHRGYTGTVFAGILVAEIWSIAWAPDSSVIAFAGRGAPIVWNPRNDQIIATYKGHSPILRSPILRTISNIAWSPDGQFIASTNIGSLKDQVVHIWSPRSGQLLTKFDVSSGWIDTAPIGGVAWSPDSTCIVCGLHGEVRTYNIHEQKYLRAYKNRSAWAYYNVCWSPDNTKLLCAFPKQAVVWNIADGTLLYTYIDHKADIRSLALSPDGKYAASSSNDTTVHIWKTDKGERIYTYEGHRDEVASVTWSPDGKRVASACKDGTVHVWQAI